MRTLVVLNENPIGSHPDVHEALSVLSAEGVVDAYQVYPFSYHRAQGMPDEEIAAEILDRVSACSVDLIVWMHTGDLDISERNLERIQSVNRGLRMVYWEGDSYHPFHKPVPARMQRIMRRCDRVFLPCGGAIVGQLRRAGVTSLYYAPSCASGTRFPVVWDAEASHDFDVVMVGNRVASRIPFKTMPGARQRNRNVALLEKRYGSRFAVFGNGWKGPFAQGPIAFDSQATVYASARIAVGVNNSVYPLVFSNRLPIAMACGIPLAYSRNPRFEEIFEEQFLDHMFSTPHQMLHRIDTLLNQESHALSEISKGNRIFFENNLSTVSVARHVVTSVLAGVSVHGHAIARKASDESCPHWMQVQRL